MVKTPPDPASNIGHTWGVPEQPTTRDLLNVIEKYPTLEALAFTLTGYFLAISEVERKGLYMYLRRSTLP